MLVELAYGTGGLEVELPGEAVVIAPRHRPAAPDALGELRRALAEPVAGPPLAELLRPGQEVAIAVCDGTRPQPRGPVLRALLEQILPVVGPRRVRVVVATGTHKPPDAAERRALAGEDLPEGVRLIAHDAGDEASLADLGTAGAGVPVRIARAFCEADLRITTGLVEPHFFAGFSGGPKLVAPGLAGLETVLHLHDARRIGDRRATFGVLEGNPVHDDVRAVAAAVGVDFCVDVVLDGAQALVRAFAGELSAAHRAACGLARETAMRAVPARFDVVVTTNAGYPLDQNLYQAVKGVAAACEVVRDGGLVVLAAECRDGYPAGGNLQHLLDPATPPEHFLSGLSGLARTEPDQWQAQVLARCLARARVVVRNEALSEAELAQVHLGATNDVARTVREELDARRGAGAAATCCVLPEGPRTIPYLSAS